LNGNISVIIAGYTDVREKSVSEIDKSDELEYASLQSSISSAERALRSSGGTSVVLKNFLENAKARMGFVEKKIKEAQEKDARVEEDAKAYLTHKQEVERETALSENDKQTYDGFLREDFFTKKDFGRLDKFYSQTWDRLTEGGKTEMSHRMWEGVRRDAYTFTELPKSVREKEAKQAYNLLRDRSKGPESALAIPENDRNDFIRAYEAGRTEDAGQILDRESFKKNLFRKADSPQIKHVSTERGREADAPIMAKNLNPAVRGAQAGDDKTPDARKTRISEVSLEGITLADAPEQQSSANIPTSQNARTKGGPSIGGG
jgi:hypothetical protein